MAPPRIGRPLAPPPPPKKVRKDVDPAFAPAGDHMQQTAGSQGRLPTRHAWKRGIYVSTVNRGITRLYDVCSRLGYVYSMTLQASSSDQAGMYTFLVGQIVHGDGPTETDAAEDVAKFLEDEHGLSPMKELRFFERLDHVCTQLDLVWATQNNVAYASYRGVHAFLLGRAYLARPTLDDYEAMYHEVADWLEGGSGG